MRRVLVGVMLLVVAGCSSSAAKVAGTTAGTNSPASIVATSATSATSPGTAGNPLDGAALCAFLEQDLPALKTAGNPVGALAQFAGDFGVWLDTHAAQKPRTAADLDSASEQSCPAVRLQVVAVLGASSFSQALG